MKKDIIPIIISTIVILLAIFIISPKDNGDFGASRSNNNIIVQSCDHSTTTIGTTATTTHDKNTNATATYRAICNDDIGESSPNSSVFIKIGATSTDEAAGFILNLGDCLELYPKKALMMESIWGVATTGSSTVSVTECGN